MALHLDTFDVSQTEEDKGREDEANVFASFFLMPEAVFSRGWGETHGLPFLDRVMKLKRIFRVSYRTVLYRLAETSELAENVWGRFQAEYKRRTGKTLGIKEELSALLRAEGPEYLAQPDFVSHRLPRLIREGGRRTHDLSGQRC